MLKKLMLLAGMALAVVAFVGTASASASTHWVHWEVNPETGEEEESTVSTITEDFTGFAKFSVVGAEGNNFGCVVHAHVTGNTINPTGTTEEAHGSVTGFEITTNTCEGHGTFAGCELEAHSTTVPWTLDVNTAPLDFTITNVGINNTYKHCLVPPAQLRFPEITAVPAPSATKINCLTISGAGLNISTAIKASGTLCAYHEGTYGVEES